MAERRQQIVFPRAVLLVEIERHCTDEHCRARNRIGLTKAEARAYRGFECVRCERWHEDTLTERDVPDWWEELTVTGLTALRPSAPDETGRPAPLVADGASEVVTRLSAAWREAQAQDADETEERAAKGQAS